VKRRKQYLWFDLCFAPIKSERKQRELNCFYIYCSGFVYTCSWIEALSAFINGKLCSYIQLCARELVFGGWRWLNLLEYMGLCVGSNSNCNPALAPLHACRMVSGAFSTELKRYSCCYTVGKWILSRFWCPLFEKAPFHPPFPEIFCAYFLDNFFLII